MRTLTWLFAISLLVAACSDDDNPAIDTIATPDSGVELDGTTADAALPTATFKELADYDGYQGTATLETEVNAMVTKVELLADGDVVATADAAPFTLEWDTTQIQDGIVSLALKAHADAEATTSAEVPVVVYNNGEIPTFEEPETQTMAVEASGIGDFDLKWHWPMPTGVTRIISVGSWDNTSFQVDLALGIGNCPHSGTEAARTASETSPILNDYAPVTQLAVDRWFAHIGPTNLDDIKGASADITVKIYLLK